MRVMGRLRIMGPMGRLRRLRRLGRLGPMGLLGVIALLGVLSCSGEQPIEEPPVSDETPITFGSAEESAQQVTRADGLEASTRAFTVWAYKNYSYDSYDNGTTGDPSDDIDIYGELQTVIPSYVVRWTDNSANSTTTNSHDWEYVNQQPTGQPEQTIKYWDWQSTAYRFFGVAGGSGTYTVGTILESPDPLRPQLSQSAQWSQLSQKTQSMTLTADVTNLDAVPYYSHLWFSTGNPTTFPDRQFGRTVQLLFLKPMVKVRFLFIKSDPTTELLLTDKSFRPTDTSKKIYRRGTFNVSYPLTGTATSETWTVSNTSNSDPTTITELTEDYTDANKQWYTLLPAKNQGSYTLTVTVNGTEKTVGVPTEFMNWEPGFQYTYVFKVNDDGSVEIGGVLSAFTNWNYDSVLDRTVYNW